MNVYPQNFSKRIVVCVSGLSPQVITETLYALVTSSNYLPTELHVITTQIGKQRIQHQLIEEGWYQKLTQELGYQLPEITSGNIHLIDTDDKVVVSDVMSDEETRASADDITRIIQQLTADEDSSVVVSITGGRKTMGFYLGHALSLFGRAQDRLTHVMVDSDFEHNNAFFFPTKESKAIYANSNDKRELDCKDAKVNLVDIPFVRLRHGLPLELLEKEDISYSSLVKAAQKNFKEPEVTLLTATNELIIDNQKIQLQPQLFAWYHWFATERKEFFDTQNKGFICPEQDNNLGERLLESYEIIADESDHGYITAKQVFDSKGGMPGDYFVTKIANVKKHLKRLLQVRAEPYLIARESKTKPSKYGLKIDPERIHIIYDEDQYE